VNSTRGLGTFSKRRESAVTRAVMERSASAPASFARAGRVGDACDGEVCGGEVCGGGACGGEACGRAPGAGCCRAEAFPESAAVSVTATPSANLMTDVGLFLIIAQTSAGRTRASTQAQIRGNSKGGFSRTARV